MNYARYAAIHARHLPEKTCLIERTPSVKQRRTLTWQAFNERINRVANYLAIEVGIRQGDYVLHLQSNSLEWLVSYYAIIKLGCVVVPLNFRFVESDVLYAAGVCSPKLFIFGAEFLPLVAKCESELTTIGAYLCVGEVPDGAASPSGMRDYRDAEAHPDSAEALVDLDTDHELAMMFTSGTTGKPKPVVHTHGSLDATAIGNGMTFFVEKEDNYVFFLPLYHSGTMFLWAPFYATGATGTLLREFKEPAWILEAIAQERGTDVLFVVPIGVALLNALRSGALRLSDYDLSSWRYLAIGAQPIPFDLMKALADTLPCGVSNTYGITEGGGGGTFNLYPDEVLLKPGSIGKPTFGVEARVVDERGAETAPGEVGELTFRTPRMMRGYFDNPELTSNALRGGWLQTGDLVKTDEQGYFYLVDRKKDLIISGGENVFPVEVEDALMEHAKIDDVACIGYPDQRLGEVVLAIVQPKAGENLTEQDICEFARARLASYKVPRKVIFDEVMRNPTGKLMKPQMREKYSGRSTVVPELD